MLSAGVMYAKDGDMNRIFDQIDYYMHEALKQGIPDVSATDFEKDGAVFYMNGKNGTAFDWYVNEHFPCFFIFYGDKENLGAVKGMLYTDGSMSMYTYGERGHAEPEHYEVKIDADEKELLELAICLTYNADGNKVWDEDIRTLILDKIPNEEFIRQFMSLKEAYQPMIERRDMMGKTVIVSRKVREEGWKIGYGLRSEPTNDRDSGWFFSVGDETEEYINDPVNLELWRVNSALMYDDALNEFITSPYGTAIVRVTSEKYELDEPGKEIFMEKRK